MLPVDMEHVFLYYNATGFADLARSARHRGLLAIPDLDRLMA
jgi:hypothetical protein